MCDRGDVLKATVLGMLFGGAMGALQGLLTTSLETALATGAASAVQYALTGYMNGTGVTWAGALMAFSIGGACGWVGFDEFTGPTASWDAIGQGAGGGASLFLSFFMNLSNP